MSAKKKPTKKRTHAHDWEVIEGYRFCLICHKRGAA